MMYISIAFCSYSLAGCHGVHASNAVGRLLYDVFTHIYGTQMRYQHSHVTWALISHHTNQRSRQRPAEGNLSN